MILGVMEGQIRGGYFPDYILDPSVIDPNGQLAAGWVKGIESTHSIAKLDMANGGFVSIPIDRAWSQEWKHSIACEHYY